ACRIQNCPGCGLRYVDLENLFRTAGTRSSPVSREDIRCCKAEAIRQMGGELLDVLEPTCGFDDIACLPHVTGYLKELNQRLHAGYFDIPRALLFAGVPGVGKSYAVRAWAYDLGYNCVAMRNVRSQWVGESERNLERVFNCLLALQPCLCFIDEIDQALGQRGQGGDSGTSERMLARIWEFMALEEHRGKIIWVGASNRPDMLDPATIDRFGIVIPFLHPTPDEIPQLLPILAKQLGHEFADDVCFEEVASLSCMQSITARSLLDIISMAALQDADEAETGIDMEHLLAATKAYRPNCNPLQHAYIALTSIRMTSFAHLLPWMDGNGKRNNSRIPSYLSDIVDDATGEVDEEKLNSELSELSACLQRENLTRLF
ncbi:ATP-binding protein, partial [Candidatus Poribacteria bacterium]